jgi:RNAse (barnase) inhibitor barstar
MVARRELVIEEGVATMQDFYNEMIRLLELADWFGNNLDAFNDALRGGCGKVDPEGMIFVWKGSTAAKERIGQANWDDIMEIFHDDDDSGHENFTVELQ